ncbi:MAG: hypothetical protein AAF646_09485 [Pseudomonadota bacterium]
MNVRRWLAVPVALTLAAFALVLALDGAGQGPSGTAEAECTAPRLWPDPSPAPDCLAPPALCPDGPGCDTAPRLWSHRETGPAHL